MPISNGTRSDKLTQKLSKAELTELVDSIINMCDMKTGKELTEKEHF